MTYVNGCRTRGGRAYRQKTHVKRFVMERDNYTCQVCSAPAEEVDHIIPWAVSHDSTFSNLRAICVKCNRRLRRQRCDANLFTTLGKWFEHIETELSLHNKHSPPR